MLSTAIVIFREAFEIALILGVVLAATRGLIGRTRYVVGGFAAGAFGAICIAFMMDTISESLEGVGQEVLNACILFTAAFFIGWTVVWMRSHAREMQKKLKQVGQDVRDSKVPYYTLSLVIGAAVLREGAEIALFTYSMIASGQPLMEIASGAALGAVGGVALGVLIYLGLVRISMKHLFAVTSSLLILLVCGLMAVGMGFLVSAGYFADLSDTVWDTSHILAEDSVLGQTLHILIGYISQPMEIQVMTYSATLATLLVATYGLPKLFNNGTAKAATVAASAVLALAMSVHDAHATKRIYAPYVEKGEMEFEVLGSHYHDDKGSKNGGAKVKTAVGYGLTDYWFTEVYYEMEKGGGHDDSFRGTAVEWANRFQLTQQGEYWADMGAYLAYEQSLDSGNSNKLEAKLLLAKDTGKFTHLLNLNLDKEIGNYASPRTEAGFAYGTHYRYSPYFMPGVEWYSKLGEIGHMKSFDEQSHQFGPAAYGHIGDTPFGYNVGYLFGVSDAAVDGEAKVILEYEKHF